MKDLFKYFVLDNNSSKVYIHWFTSNFPDSEFESIDKILYLFLVYCDKLGINAKRKYLNVFLSTELKSIVRKYNIKLDSIINYNYEEISAFEQAIQVIFNNTLDVYDSYCTEVIDGDIDDEFKVNVSQFMNNNLKDRITNIFTREFTNMSVGDNCVNIAERTQMSMASAKEIYDTEKLVYLDILLGNKQKSSSEDKARLISKTGIPAIDEDYGGVFSKALITFAGQPGYGKTRLLISIFIYNALVHYKVGVRLDELELNSYEIKNMLLSIHIAKIFKVKIPDRDINRDNLSDEQRKIVESARIDLFESGKYGRFVLVTKRGLYVETMKEEAINFFKLNPDIQIWAIDYIGRIQSKPLNKYDKKSLPEVINDSLMIAKDVAVLMDIASICANQFNEDGNKAALAGKPIAVGMIQGGQAVQRHSDYDIAMTATDSQKAANLRMISSTKERASIGYSFVPLSVDLAISNFKQVVLETEGRQV